MSTGSKFLSNPFSRHKSKGGTPTPSRPNSSHGSAASTGPASTPSGMQSVNPQLPPASVPAKDGALEKAIQAYINKLSDDDKAAFQSAPDIVERLQEMQRNDKSLVSSSMAARVEKVLQCVKYFMGSLLIFIQQSPEISSLVVGGVNCILTVGIRLLDPGEC